MIVYTAVFGSYHLPFPQPAFLKNKLVCFTDKKSGYHNGWQLVSIESKEFVTLSSSLKNRYCKLNPHLLFPKEEQSVYIDSNFIVLKPIDEFVKEKLSEKDFWAFNHLESTGDKRNCIYKEAKAIEDIYQKTGKKKDDLDVIRQQIDWFKKEGYPEDNGLIKGGVIIRNHLVPKVIQTNECWWNIVSTKSKRDQLSFNYCAWKHNFDFGYLAGDIRRGNPYFKLNGGHQSNYALHWWKAKKNQIKNCR